MNNSDQKPKTLKDAFSYTTQVAGKHWDPTEGRAPFKVMTGLGYLEDIIKGEPGANGREGESPKILPFPLDRIVDQLAKSYEELMKTRSVITVSIRTALLSNQDKALLRLDLKYIDRGLDDIKKISKDIERMQL